MERSSFSQLTLILLLNLGSCIWVIILRRLCLCLCPSSCYHLFFFSCGRFLFRQVMMVTDKCTPSSHKHSLEMRHGARPKTVDLASKSSSHPDPARGFTTEQWHRQKLTAHMTSRIHHRCPGVPYQRDTQTGPVSRVL